MSGHSWLRGALVITVVTVLAVALTAPAAFSRRHRRERHTPTPTATPTPTPTPTPIVKIWNFDQDKAGQAAAGWKAIAGQWEVIADPTAPSQPNTYGLPPGRLFQSLIHGLSYNPMTVETDPTQYSDFTLEASFKSVGGRLDCSGGLIFRYADAQDYYVVSAGCPSDYFTLGRVYKGKLSVIHQEVVPTDRDTWYQLKVVAKGSHFDLYDDGKLVFGGDDDRIAKGRIGLWAQDDSQARFDNVTITLPPPGEAATSAATPGALPPPPTGGLPPLPPPP